MKEDTNGLNSSIKNFLNNEANLQDLKSLIAKFNNLTSNHYLEINGINLKDYNKEDIQKCSSIIKGNKLLNLIGYWKLKLKVTPIPLIAIF